MKRRLCKVDDVPFGGLYGVELDGLSLVVVRTSAGALSVLRGICPHAGARLSLGRVIQKVEAGQNGTGYALGRDFVIRCPWHAYEFDVNTGCSVVEGDARRVRTYPASVEDDYVVIDR